MELLGHAQRRRKGLPSNVYGATTQQPSFGPGDSVKAQGRYGAQKVVIVVPNVARPDGVNDGHGYVVRGGKKMRTSVHMSGELRPIEMGMGEHQ